MADESDKSFLDRLGEILNAPLPGTQRPAAGEQRSPIEEDDDDDDSLLERIKEILNTPLPGTETESIGKVEPANESAPQTDLTTPATTAEPEDPA